jgi:antitoxin component YwqK of YwqJK toxin-antitoxin module
MKRALARTLEYQEDGLYYLDNEPFTGVAFTLSKDGWEKAEMHYKQGLRWGPTKEWYAPGQPMVDSCFFKGVLHGRAREWHRNGQLAEDGVYEYGITRWEKKWDENGDLESDVVLKESDNAYQALLRQRKLYGEDGTVDCNS